MKKSKYTDLIQRGRPTEQTIEPTPKRKRGAKPTIQPTKQESEKRFHTSVYPDKDFYVNVKIALLKEGKDRDFNQLVNDLLKEWYDAHGDE